MGRLGRHGQPFVLKFGNDLSFADLKNSPSILIGLSRWTAEFTRTLRFRFVNEGGMLRIFDSQNPERSWAIPAMGRSDRATGYSVVTRPGAFGIGATDASDCRHGRSQYDGRGRVPRTRRRVQ